MADTVWQGLVSIDFQDNDTPGKLARLMAILEDEVKKAGNMPGIDLGSRLMGSLGEGVATVQEALGRVAEITSSVQAQISRLNTGAGPVQLDAELSMQRTLQHAEQLAGLLRQLPQMTALPALSAAEQQALLNPQPRGENGRFISRAQAAEGNGGSVPPDQAAVAGVVAAANAETIKQQVSADLVQESVGVESVTKAADKIEELRRARAEGRGDGPPDPRGVSTAGPRDNYNLYDAASLTTDVAKSSYERLVDALAKEAGELEDDQIGSALDAVDRALANWKRAIERQSEVLAKQQAEAIDFHTNTSRVDPFASARIQGFQLTEARARAALEQMGSANALAGKQGLGAQYSDAALTEARIKVQQAVENTAAAQEKEAEAARKAARQAELQANTDLSIIDQTRTARVQQLQLNKAIAEGEFKTLSAVTDGSVTAKEIQQARIRVLTAEEALAAQIERERKATEADAGTGGGGGGKRTGFLGGLLGGFGGQNEGGSAMEDLATQAGFALKYYAFYKVFELGTTAINGIKTNTEQYSLAVNQLSLALGTNYEQASKVAQAYASIGSGLGTAPAIAINAATTFTRAFQDKSGAAGTAGATLGSQISLLEATGDPEKDAEETVKRLQDVIAIATNYKMGPTGAQHIYDAATVIAQQYGVGTGGSLLSGTGQIADLLSESGYSPEQGLALIAGVMQRTGGTSDVAAGDLKRFLGRQGQSTFQSIFAQYGIDQNQPLQGELGALAKKFPNLGEQQQTSIISALGGGRAGAAVASALLDYNKQQDAAKKGTDATGTAADQAAKRLQTFAGQIEKITGDLHQLGADIGSSPIGGALQGILGIVDPLVKGIDAIVRGINGMPAPMRDAAIAAGTLYAAMKTLGGVAGLTALLNKVGGGKAAGAAGAAEGAAGAGAVGAAEAGAAGAAFGLGSTLRLAGNPLAGTLERGSAGVVSRLAGSLGGLASAAGRALLAIGPLAIAIAGLVTVGLLKDNGDKANAAGASAIADAKNLDAAARGNDVQGLKAGIKDMQKQYDAIANSSAGYAGGIQFGLYNAGYNLFHRDGKDLSYSQTQALNAMKAEIERRKADLAIAERKTAGPITERTAATNLFGSDYSGVETGLDLLHSKRTGVGASVKTLNELIQKKVGDAATLKELLQPEQGQQGIDRTIADLTKQVQHIRDPKGRAAGFAKIRELEQQVLDSALKNGDADLISTSQDQLDATTKTSNADLIQTLQNRLASIKAFNANNKATQAKLHALATTTLQQVAATGDVDSTAQVMNGLDVATVNAFQKSANSLLNSLQHVKSDALKAAAMAARLEAQVAALEADNAGLGEGGAGANSANAAEYANNQILDAKAKMAAANKKLADATKAANAQQTVVDTVQTARDQAAPSGSDFQYPKDSAAPKGPSAQDIEIARIQAKEIPGDPLSAAQIALEVARYQLAHAKDQQQYWQAVKALHEAQYQYGQVALSMAEQADLSRIDITNPLALAQEKVRQAQRQLAADQKRGALGDVLQTDRNALRQAQSDAEKTAFDQKFNDEKTNYDLQRISLGAYLSYLRSQHDYLTAVKHRTYQQNQELNEVDQALKSLADGMQGQFNLGDIKVPSPYEVRRAMAAAGGATTSVQNVTVNVNGGNTAEIKAVLDQYLGQGATQRTGTTTTKV